MKLQAVTVSVDYSDFLIHTIEENHTIFDKWFIVTNTKDLKTKELCEKYKDQGVVCIQTDVFYDAGAKFNKYSGINEGLKYVDEDAWVLFVDSDIVLDKDLRYILFNLDLDKTCVYGMDRVNCIGLQAWLDYKNRRDLVLDKWLLTDGGFKFGARLVHYYGYENGDGKFAGWNPIGFFQLAYRSAFKKYPDDSTGADHCDLAFARLWPRRKRILIPESIAIHLESENTYKAANWFGRVSEPFVVKEKQDPIDKDYDWKATTLPKTDSTKYVNEEGYQSNNESKETNSQTSVSSKEEPVLKKKFNIWNILFWIIKIILLLTISMLLIS